MARQPVVANARIVVRDTAFVGGIVGLAGDVEHVRFGAQHLVAMRHTGRDAHHNGGVVVTQVEFHELAGSGTVLAGVVQRHLDIANRAIPPVGLDPWMCQALITP